ncbi:spore maturation protein [Anaeropeptidivorans aminofermentans]|jgi:spore maturation protein B|uniref:spore maturation protein n=1 Tax=Anaeropeptidivorans aminofermentans TaxID=2934315 RepID=UPI0020252EAD|nr:nucleoside recognition domain-containing protein [Anaeropeptidivorans aminofermentans]MBE6011048.1 spore maturation protein [Lachnospiraceae bacterium]
MKILIYMSDLIMPIMFVAIILYGISNKVALYDVFIEGALDGAKTVIKIFPTLIGLMVAVGILRDSGALDLLCGIMAPLTEKIGFPTEAMPLTLMRLVSSAASRGLLLDIFKTYGPDSFTGRFVSIMMSSTETILYTMSIYFMSIKITKTRYTLAGALIANFSAVFMALIITRLLY